MHYAHSKQKLKNKEQVADRYRDSTYSAQQNLLGKLPKPLFSSFQLRDFRQGGELLPV